MTEHPAIDKWARKRFASMLVDIDATTATFRIAQETEQHGYCETCSYETEVVEVYMKEPGKPWTYMTKIETDLAEIMREILDASMETN